MFGLTWVGRLYKHFRRLLLLDGILPSAKFTLRPPSLALSYSQRYCAAVEQWLRAKLCVVEHRSPPIFCRATIRLGIGPHSSFDLLVLPALYDLEMHVVGLLLSAEAGRFEK